MDYKKIILITVVFLALALVGLLISSNFLKGPTVTIKDKTFNLLVAKSENDRQIGLSKHKRLPQDSGMVFLFDRPDLYTFWMKDMKFPIDIIFIRGNKIVTIYPDLEPPKPNDNNLPVLSPKTRSDKVLEINAGLSKKYNFKNGDEVKISNL